MSYDGVRGPRQRPSGSVRAGVDFYETAHWSTRRAGMPDGGPLGRRRGLEGRCRDVATSALFRASQFVSATAACAAPAGSAPPSPATFGEEGAETESSRAGANLKAIIAAFCAPLPAPLPIVARVAYLIRIEETRLHSYHGSASRGDEGNSQRQFAC